MVLVVVVVAVRMRFAWWGEVLVLFLFAQLCLTVCRALVLACAFWWRVSLQALRRCRDYAYSP